MASINIYKLNEETGLTFIEDTNFKSKMSQVGSVQTIELENGEKYNVRLFLTIPNQPRTPTSWNHWVVKPFDENRTAFSQSSSAAILLIENKADIYVATFGNSFFLIDQYCDKDFGFSVGKKLEYKEIKTTALSNPGSKRNKTVSTYKDYNHLTIDSGESFAKLKAQMRLPEEFELFNSTIEIGNSIRVSIKEENTSIRIICQIIDYITQIMQNDDKYLFPVFTQVRKKTIIDELNNNLLKAINEQPSKLEFSEFEIIGTNEVFNNCDYEYSLSYEKFRSEKYDNITIDDIRSFCKKNDLEFEEIALEITVFIYHEGKKSKKKVYELIDYTDDKMRCLLSRGKWYQYNDTYVTMLNESIKEIQAEYHPEFDFTNEEYNSFIKQILQKENITESKENVEIYKKKYYREFAFNMIRAEKNGFEIYDRNMNKLEGHSIESMDLYKDGITFSVKIGGASSDLCYVIDQSLITLELYKTHRLNNISINSIGIWIIFKNRINHIEDESGKPDITKLKMLMLKNRIDNWKKAVLLAGCKPIIYINYAN